MKMVNDVAWDGVRFRSVSKSEGLQITIPAKIVKMMGFKKGDVADIIINEYGKVEINNRPNIKKIQYAEEMPDRMFFDQPEEASIPIDAYMTDMCNWLHMTYPKIRERAEYMIKEGIKFRDTYNEINIEEGTIPDYKTATNRLIRTMTNKEKKPVEPVAEPVKPVADDHKELMLSFVSMIKDPKQIGYLEYQCKMFATKNQMEKAELWDLTPEFIVDNFEMDKLSPAFKHYVNGLKMGV